MQGMRRRWSLVLPLWGVLLFSLVTYESFRFNREVFGNRPNRIFYWSVIRLDSEPRNQHSREFLPCKNGGQDCWQSQTVWGIIEPGLMTKLLLWAGFPALVAGVAMVRLCARLGISEVTTFLTSMPLVICVWYYLLGWLADRWLRVVGTQFLLLLKKERPVISRCTGTHWAP